MKTYLIVCLAAFSLMPVVVCGQLQPSPSNSGSGFVPTGYEQILSDYTGKGSPVDLDLLAKFAVQWSRQAVASLAFFEKELDSGDEARTKASLRSISILAGAVGYEGNGLVDAPVRSEFYSKFPTDKIRNVISGRPVYAIALMFRPGSREKALFPELPALKKQYFDEKEKAQKKAK